MERLGGLLKSACLNLTLGLTQAVGVLSVTPVQTDKDLEFEGRVCAARIHGIFGAEFGPQDV